MKPVLVLQNLSADGPAYLGQWLQSQGVPFDVRNAQAGDAFPRDLRSFGALALLGGEMSANDDLPHLRQTEALVRDAVQRSCPVIGHCLGGQLMARALGARVFASPRPEVGWHGIDVEDSAEARGWFGDARTPIVFEWHEDAFELPAGALRLAGNASCPNQAFAIGPHLGLQFHVELDIDKLRHWAASQAPDFLEAQRLHGTVHSGAAQLAGAQQHLQAQQVLAARLYARWLHGDGDAR